MPPLILISGLLSNQRLWQHQVALLKEITDVQVVAPSQESYPEMVQFILDRAPERFVLAGHSMGGSLALEVVRAAKERVVKLCLLNTTARVDTEEKAKRRREMIQRAKEGHFSEIVDELAACFVENPLVVDDVKEMFLSVGSSVFIHQEKAMLGRPKAQAFLSQVACKTVVIHAADDKNFSLEEHQELASMIPKSELIVIDHSGHMSPMERPEEVTAALYRLLKAPF